MRPLGVVWAVVAVINTGIVVALVWINAATQLSAAWGWVILLHLVAAAISSAAALETWRAP